MIQPKVLNLFTLIFCSIVLQTVRAALPPSEDTNKIIPTKTNSVQLQKVLDILDQYDIEQKHFAISLHDLRDNNVSLAFRKDELHIPASVTKVFTTLFALKTLTAQKKFYTKLAYTGSISENILNGDLYLIGGGDPYLTSEKLLNLAMHLHHAGIYKVKGNFYFDESLLPKYEKISLVGLEDHTYNSSISALSTDFNRIRIIKTKDGFETLPKLPFLEIKTTSEKLGPGEKFQRDYLVSLHSGAGENKEIVERWYASKKGRYRRVEEIPIREPARFSAAMFNFYCQKLGIQLPSPKVAKAPKGLKPIFKTSSPELIRLAKLALYYSNNLIAETLLFHAAKHISDKPIQTMIEASRVMEKWLTKQYPNSKFPSLKLQNGSGLSSANVVSTNDLSNFLHAVHDEAFDGSFFWSIFPTSAHSGFLRKKFLNNNTAYNIWAKTGSIDYVNNIAGYLFSSTGKKYAFAIMFQNLDGRKVVDGSNSSKVEKFRQKAKRFRRKTSKATEKILELLTENF